MQVIYFNSTGKEPFHLDAKDQALLATIAANARTPATILAKKLRLSPEVVRYRTARLRSEHVLMGARAVISLALLGYSSYHLLLPLQSDGKRTLKFLMEDSRVNAVVEYLGPFEFEAAVRTKDAASLRDFIRDLSINADAGRHILQLSSTIKSTALPACITPVPIHLPKPGSERPALDDKDKLLLTSVADNADEPIVSLMQRTGLSRDQVSYRLKSLQKKGVIMSYVPVINYARLGFSMHAVLLKLRNRSIKSEMPFLETLRQHPNVLWAVQVIGDWDIMLYLLTRRQEEIVDFASAIRTQFPGFIGEYELLMALREHKYSYLPGGDL